MILIDDDKKEPLSLKFIRNMLNLSIYDFAGKCGIDSSLVSKMENGTTTYYFKYKKILFSLVGISNIVNDKNIYYSDIDDVLNKLLYQNTVVSAQKLENIDFDYAVNSKYFLDYYLIGKIISISSHKNSFMGKFDNDKFDSIILKLKNCTRDTEMLINIYLIYKEIQLGSTTLLKMFANKYNIIDKYSHYTHYILFLESIISLKYPFYSNNAAELAFQYKNFLPNVRSRQIISLARTDNWLKNPSIINYKKLINSQKLFVKLCDNEKRRNNFYTVISFNFIQEEYQELIKNMDKNIDLFDTCSRDIGEHLFFMCAIASYKLGNFSRFKLYLGKLKSIYEDSDAKYLVEMVEKYPTGKSIKRATERQIKKIFKSRRPANILILLLEYNKVYDVSQFECVRYFLEEHPNYRLF